MAVVRTTKIPRRRTPTGEENPTYQEKLTQAHSGVLGAAALIQAFQNRESADTREDLAESHLFRRTELDAQSSARSDGQACLIPGTHRSIRPQLLG